MKHSSHILELAKRGAEARLRELAQEAKYLVELFPHLRDSFDPDELPMPFIIAAGRGDCPRPARNVTHRACRRLIGRRSAHG